MKKNKQGFTLIELLVVIAIIGILATIALVSLSSARQKARDAKRVSEVKQIAQALEIQDTDVPDTAIGCGATTPTDLSTCSIVGNTDLVFANFKDPSKPTTLCGSASGAPCKYSIKSGSKTSDYEICFGLEATNNVGTTTTAGVKSIRKGSVFADTCSF